MLTALDEQQAIARIAAIEAESTCEMCGEAGRMMRKGQWHKTLCKDDALLLGFKDT